MENIWKTRISQILLLGSWILGDILLLPQVVLEIRTREFWISLVIFLIWCICCFFLGIWTPDRKICRIKIHAFGIICILLVLAEVLSYYGGTDLAMILTFVINVPLPIWVFHVWDLLDLSWSRGMEILCCGLLPYILIWLSVLAGTYFAKEGGIENSEENRIR